MLGRYQPGRPRLVAVHWKPMRPACSRRRLVSRPHQSIPSPPPRRMTLWNYLRLFAGCLRTANSISAAVPPPAVPLTCHERVSPRHQHSLRDAAASSRFKSRGLALAPAKRILVCKRRDVRRVASGNHPPTEQSSRRDELERMIHEEVPSWFKDRILPVTRSIAEQWGVLDGERQLAGRPLNIADGMIAATALEHGLTLVTRNVRDFGGLGLVLLCPWDAA